MEGDGCVGREELFDERGGVGIDDALAEGAGLPLFAIEAVVLGVDGDDVWGGAAEVEFPGVCSFDGGVGEVEGEAEVFGVDVFECGEHVPDGSADVVVAAVILVLALDAEVAVHGGEVGEAGGDFR